MIRDRDAARVRVDAIGMAIKKGVAGCLGCAEGYFAAARQHGATDAEIERAITTAPLPGAPAFTRRTLLQIAAAGVASLAVKPLQMYSVAEAATTQSTSGLFWGSDTNSSTYNTGVPQDFYVGQVGSGATQGGYFIASAAQAAGRNQTYGYWTLEGPFSANKPAPTSAYGWGQQQAADAYAAVLSGPNSRYIGGPTIFADMESGNNGWLDSNNNKNQPQNQAVVSGYVEWMVEEAADFSTSPGIYTSSGFWSPYIGQSYRAKYPFVLWVTGCKTCSIQCTPCTTGCDPGGQVAALLQGVVKTTLGGSEMAIWQYFTSGQHCPYCPNESADADVALQNPKVIGGFRPIPANSRTTYSAPACPA